MALSQGQHTLRGNISQRGAGSDVASGVAVSFACLVVVFSGRVRTLESAADSHGRLLKKSTRPILAEGAIALPVTLSGGVLFAS